MAKTVTTIGDHLDRRYHAWAYCNHHFPPPPCEGTSGTELDLEALAVQYGRDLPMAEVAQRIRCRVCGGPGRISISHDGRPKR